MKYFIDCEFIEDGKTIDLVSIAIVAEDNRKLYRISKEFDASLACPFVVKNVFPFLVDAKTGKAKNPEVWKTKKEIKNDILEFIGNDKDIEFWAYYGSYDWIVFCQLFGTMMDLPANFPKWIHELKQLAEVHTNIWPPLTDETQEHHPLYDAEWCKQYHDKIMKGFICR